jgi:hypothetical protein
MISICLELRLYKYSAKYLTIRFSNSIIFNFHQYNYDKVRKRSDIERKNILLNTAKFFNYNYSENITCSGTLQFHLFTCSNWKENNFVRSAYMYIHNSIKCRVLYGSLDISRNNKYNNNLATCTYIYCVPLFLCPWRTSAVELFKRWLLLQNWMKKEWQRHFILTRFLVPHGHSRCIPSHCSRCEHGHGHHHHSVSLSRNTSTSRESVHSAHMTENVSASATGMFNQSVSVSSSTHKESTIRRQHSQPESSCLYCHAHRLVFKANNDLYKILRYIFYHLIMYKLHFFMPQTF